jgi:tryptophan halogenase
VDAKPIRKIVILGGGTAGWMAAAYIQRALANLKHECSMTVIASDEIGTIGVGEATVPTIHTTLKFIGMTPSEWMDACSSTFKLGVRFLNWTKSGNEYWHPFGPLAHDEATEAANYWLRARMDGEAADFFSVFFPTYHAATNPSKGYTERNRKSDKSRAYHLDATLLGRLLKGLAISRGAHYRSDEIVSVTLAENGFIKSLVTKAGEEIEGDLFIDCSGFRSVLMQGALKEPFDSYGKHLICDRAIAISTDITEPQMLCTTATALSAGWSWNIPLTTRNGVGYVYSSNHISQDDAEREIRQLVGPAGDRFQSRHIKIRVGKSRRTWVKNCVAIGLSGGFIEPLESTGIFLIEAGLKSLVMFFPDQACDESLRRRYNDEMTAFYEEIRDFINLHYIASQRTDTSFWRDASDIARITPAVQECIDNWRECACAPEIARKARLFPDFSWLCIMIGSGILPPRPIPLFEGMDSERVNEVIDRSSFLSATPSFAQ